MHTNRTRTLFVRLNLALVTLLLATFGTIFAAAPATAQELSPQLLATQYFDALGGGTSFAMLSPSAVLHTPEGEFAGTDGIGEFRSTLDASFSNVEFRSEAATASGDLVIVSFTMTGISTGSYQGIAANCAGFSTPAVAVLKVSNLTVVTESTAAGALSQHLEVTELRNVSTVTEQWISYDSDAIASQIASFNQWAPNTAFGCANHVLPQNVAPTVLDPKTIPSIEEAVSDAAATDQLPPACSNVSECDLPY